MAEFKDLIDRRRSVRDFDPSHGILDEDLNYIVESAMTTPTSFNIQNWRFVAVRDRGIKEKIKRASWNQTQVASNSVLMLLCADLKAWDKDPERYWVANGAEVAATMAEMTRGFYNGKTDIQRDEAMRSIGMAATAIMLAATDIGYKCSPMIGFDPVSVAEIINLPEDHVVGMMIAIGKSDSDPYPKTTIPIREALIYDFFPS